MKTIIAATILISVGLITAVQAGDDHWDRFSCYAYVHDQCFPSGETNCDSEGYNDALDECDGYYPTSRIPRPPGNVLKTPSKKVIQSTRAVIQNSFK